MMSTLFFLIAITMIWYLPGLLVRAWKEDKAEKKFNAEAKQKAAEQAKAIAKLYPKKVDS